MTETTAPRAVSFAALVQQFFTEYLINQRALSPRTIQSYRDAMLLFLDFSQHHLGKMPTALNLCDIKPDLILAFLDHLEQVIMPPSRHRISWGTLRETLRVRTTLLCYQP